jgi:hypothetical protein
MGFPFYLLAECIALIIGTLFLKRGASLISLYKSVWWFVLLSFVVDLFGTFCFQIFKLQNGWLYNLYDLYKYLALAYIVGRLVGIGSRYAGFTILTIILGSALVDFCVVESANDLFFYLTVVGDVTLIFLCLYYFRSIFVRPVYERLTGIPYFWLVTGIFLYFLCMLPFHFFWDMITNDHLKHISGLLYNIIATISIFILYGGISIFFILCKYPIRQ